MASILGLQYLCTINRKANKLFFLLKYCLFWQLEVELRVMGLITVGTER